MGNTDRKMPASVHVNQLWSRFKVFHGRYKGEWEIVGVTKKGTAVRNMADHGKTITLPNNVQFVPSNVAQVILPKKIDEGVHRRR